MDQLQHEGLYEDGERSRTVANCFTTTSLQGRHIKVSKSNKRLNSTKISSLKYRTDIAVHICQNWTKPNSELTIIIYPNIRCVKALIPPIKKKLPTQTQERANSTNRRSHSQPTSDESTCHQRCVHLPQVPNNPMPESATSPNATKCHIIQSTRCPILLSSIDCK